MGLPETPTGFFRAGLGEHSPSRAGNRPASPFTVQGFTSADSELIHEFDKVGAGPAICGSPKQTTLLCDDASVVCYCPQCMCLRARERETGGRIVRVRKGGVEVLTHVHVCACACVRVQVFVFVFVCTCVRALRGKMVAHNCASSFQCLSVSPPCSPFLLPFLPFISFFAPRCFKSSQKADERRAMEGGHCPGVGSQRLAGGGGEEPPGGGASRPLCRLLQGGARSSGARHHSLRICRAAASLPLPGRALPGRRGNVLARPPVPQLQSFLLQLGPSCEGTARHVAAFCRRTL